jgi:hypothetical protein
LRAVQRVGVRVREQRRAQRVGGPDGVDDRRPRPSERRESQAARRCSAGPRARGPPQPLRAPALPAGSGRPMRLGPP